MALSNTTRKKEIKASDITPDMVQTRIEDILKALADSSDFQFNLLVLQLANWPKAKRRQTFRGVFKVLLSGGYTFGWRMLGPKLRAKGISFYNVHNEILINELFTKFVNKIRHMEKNARFIPEKVYTIPSLNLKMLQLEPEILDYLLRNNIIVIGEGFSLKKGNSLPTNNALYTLRYMRHNIKQVLEVYQEYGLDHNILLNPDKLQLMILYRIMKNIDILATHIVGNQEKITGRDFLAVNDCMRVLTSIEGELDTSPNAQLGSNKVEKTKTRESLEEAIGSKALSKEAIMIARNEIAKEIEEIQNRFAPILGREILEVSKDFDGELFDPSKASFRAT